MSASTLQILSHHAATELFLFAVEIQGSLLFLRGGEPESRNHGGGGRFLADFCSPTGRTGAGLLAPTLAAAARARSRAAARAAARAEARAAARVAAGLPVPLPQSPKSGARRPTGPSCPVWRAKQPSFLASATPIPRPAWMRKACCGAASTKRIWCNESSTSPPWYVCTCRPVGPRELQTHWGAV